VADPRVGRPAIGGLALLCVWLPSCASSATLPAGPGPAGVSAASFSNDSGPLPRYHSKRLALWLSLPPGGWRIDDHSRPELEATQALTHSRVVVAILHTDDIVGRSQCEELAATSKIVADKPLQTVDDEVATTQRTFDTRIRVALAPPEHEGGPLVGHVLAFGGYLRKCYVFDFSTEVAGLADEPALSSRLAFARTRILGGLELESLAPPRLTSDDLQPGAARR
jgi:hypothetical protein